MEQQDTTVASQPLSENLKEILASGENLLRHSADQAGAEYRHARTRFEAMMGDVKTAIATGEAAASRKARLAKAEAEIHIHANPWQSLGYAAAAAGVLGLLVGLLAGRR